MQLHRPDPLATTRGIFFGVAIIPKAQTPQGHMELLQKALLNPATARPISIFRRTTERLRQLLD